MAAEHAAIRVQLVDDDVTQGFEQLRPTGMMRQDSRMDHVGIAENEVRACADRTAGVLRCIPVVREHANLLARSRRERLAHRGQLGELILGERFRGKQVQRPARAILQDGIENRRVVTQSFSRSRGSNDHCMSAGQRVRDRVGLVGIELRDAARDKHILQAAIERFGKRRVPSTDGW